MAQMFEDDFGGRIAEGLMNIDVHLSREFSHEVTQEQREQGRIDWKDRNSANMKKIAQGEVNRIYQ